MFTLRLFHQNEPFVQIRSHRLRDGVFSVGRDEAADWPIVDPSLTLSRRHCVFAVGEEGLTVRDASANGVFVGPHRRRLTRDQPTPVKPGEAIRLGDYIILVEVEAEVAEEAPAQVPAPTSKIAEIPTRLNLATAPRPVGEASLMEAFCAGARLDASAFSGEDPAQVMRRLGAVYHEMITGLAGLMAERTVAKTKHQLERTAVRAARNNPFRWAPAERVAVDLLRPRDDGFLSGPDAVQLSFSDLNKHLACTLAGARAAVAATQQVFDPALILEAAKARSFSLKGRSAEAWSLFVEVYGDNQARSLDNPESPASKAFREAYECELETGGADRTVS